MDNEIEILMGAIYAIDGMIHDDYEYFITCNNKGEPLKIKYTDIRDYLTNRMVEIWRGQKKMSEEMIEKMIDDVIWSLFETNQDDEFRTDEVSEKELLYQSAYNDALIDVRKCLLDRLDDVVIG